MRQSARHCMLCLASLPIMLQLPSAGNVSFRPAVAIPLFFGIAFGPIVGFIAGFLGNIISDLISGYGFWVWWDIGNGLMGLVAGLMAFSFTSFKERGTLLKAELYVVLGVVVGMGVASLSEMWVSGADINTVIYGNFLPAADCQSYQRIDPRSHPDDRVRRGRLAFWKIK